MTASKSTVCTVCYRPISRKADMPRHMRTHMANKDELMHRCPISGCDYKTLQKSNVKTHLRTHTGEKTQKCPTEGCTYATTDPGSLTKHRKRVHDYKPRPHDVPARNEALGLDRFFPNTPYPTIDALSNGAIYSMTPESTSATTPSEVIDLTHADYMLSSSSQSSSDSWASGSSAGTSQSNDSCLFAWDKDLLSFPSSSTDDFSKLFEQPQLFPCSPPEHVLPGAGAMDESNQLWSSFPTSDSYSVDVNFGSSFNMFAGPAISLPPLSSDSQWPTAWSLSDLDASFAPTFPTQSYPSYPPLNWENMMAMASSCGSPTETPSSASSSPQPIADLSLCGSMDQHVINSFLSGCFA